MAEGKPQQSTRTLDAQDRKTIARFRHYGVQACVGIMVLGLSVGLLFFARPSTSAVEKRNLTAFPEVNAQSFLNGEFFTHVSLWYADTYPLREPLVAANRSIQRLYGIQPSVQLVGGNVAADSIPTEGMEAGASTNTNTNNSKPTATIEQRQDTDTPEIMPMQEAVQEQLMNGVVLYDGAGYNLYYFLEDNVNTYLNAVNELSRALEGQAELYAMFIPNSSAVLLPADELEALGGSNQEQTINYFIGKLDTRIHTINCLDVLAPHAEEYIFFRSDHHWTQLGAYFAYTAFCEKRGIEPVGLDAWNNWETLVFEPFLGTFYTETYNAQMAENPDRVEAHIPPATNNISYWIDHDFVQQEGGNIITDVSTWDSNAGYYCFTIGDMPLIRIDNPEMRDGSSILVLKDSYGNSLVPQLVYNYQTVWVIDYRYSSTSIVDFVKENNISEVLLENNIAIATAPAVGQALLDQVEGNTNSQL